MMIQYRVYHCGDQHTDICCANCHVLIIRINRGTLIPGDLDEAASKHQCPPDQG